MGMDSLMALDLKTRLEAALGAACQPRWPSSHRRSSPSPPSSSRWSRGRVPSRRPLRTMSWPSRATRV